MNSNWRLSWVPLILLIIYQRDASSQKLVCYYAKGSEDRNYAYRLLPEDIDASLCTHLVYACTIPDLTEGMLPTEFLRSLTSDGGADEFTKLRRRNDNLNLILSIGGWNEGSQRFSKIVSKLEDTNWFARHAIDIVRYLGFDGLDINWQWPGLREGGSDEDKAGFVMLIQTLKKQMVRDAEERMKKPLSLSVVLPPLKEMADRGFELNILKREVDYFMLMTMDYYLPTDPHVNHHAPLHSLSCNQKHLSVDATVKYYLSMGIDSEKMVLGIPLYGNSYTLENEYDTKIGSNAEDEGIKGFGTRTFGNLAYFEICKYVKDYRWTVKSPNISAVGPYAYLLRNWVAYDDAAIIKQKIQYAKKNCLGGVMLWTIDMDDFKGWCHEKFHLTKTANLAMFDPSDRVSCMPQLSILTQIIKETTTTTTTTTTSAPPSTTIANPTTPKSSKPFKMIKREKWQASPPTEDIPKLRVYPARFVIITNTVSQSCSNFAECKEIVKNTQSYHISIGFGDIGYSFMIGGDGNVYEGLGWNRHGAHTLPFNARSIGIAFIGEFTREPPPQKQIDAALRLINESVRLGHLSSSYTLFGQRQVIAVNSPGNKLMNIIKTWPHWAEYDPIEHDDD